MTTSLLKNFASLTGAEVFSKLVTFTAFAYLARLCGPAGFGYIEWAGTVLMCSSLIVDQGFSAYGAREIAKSPSETPRLVAEVITARFLLAGLGYLAIMVFAFWFVREETIASLLLVYGLSLWALPLLLQWVFQGHERMHLVGMTQAVRQTVFVLAIFAFVGSAADLLWVGLAEVAGVTSAAAVSVWLYKRYFSKHVRLAPAFSAKLFREGVPIGLSQMFWVVKMFGATFIIGLVATAEDTGYFAGAMRIYIALHTFVWLYFFNMLPSMSRAWEHGPEQFSGLISHSIRIVALISLAGGVVWVLSAPLIMTSVYGPNFSPGAGALQWLAGACIAAAISGHYRFGLVAAGYQSKEMFSAAVGAVIAAVFIPIGYLNAGTAGAAAVLCVAECSVLLCVWIIAKRTLFNRSADGLRVGETSLERMPGATL